MLPHQPDITIKKVVMADTGQYHDQFYRPYETSLDLQTLNNLTAITEGGTLISQSNLAGVAGNIIRPSAMVQGNVGIANGWGEQRLRFFMEVEIGASIGYGQIHVYSGYTDHKGVNFHTSSLDPSMRLYFNGCMRLQSTRVRNANGVTDMIRPRDACQVLATPEDEIGHGGINTISMRPTDVFSGVDQAQYGAIDGRVGFSLGAKTSKRSNANTPQYLSDTISAMTSSIQQGDYFDESYETVTSESRAKVGERDYGEDPFLSMFSQNQYNEYAGSVTWGELLGMCPHLEQVTELSLHNPNMVAVNDHRTSSAGFGGADRESVVAATFASALPSIMLDCMVMEMAFTATNATIGTDYEIIPADARTFSDHMDARGPVSVVLDRVRNEILQTISMNNQIGFGVSVYCDVIGETRISVSSDGGLPVEFVTPTFADARMAPVMARDVNTLNAISHDITNICHNLTNHATMGL